MNTLNKINLLEVNLLSKKPDGVVSLHDDGPILKSSDSSREDDFVKGGFLKDKILLAQRLKKELGIENQAAITGLEAIGAAAALVAIIKATIELYGHINKKNIELNVSMLSDKAVKSLGAYWSDNLVSTHDYERQRAAKAIAEGKFDNPAIVLNDVKEAIKELIDSQDKIDAELLGTNIKITRGLFAALEGLYLRADTESISNECCEEFIELLKNTNKNKVIDSSSRNSIRRILINNWKVPVKYKLPDPCTTEGDNRIGYYGVILGTVKDMPDKKASDSLFLKTSDDLIPANLQESVKELKRSLVKNLHEELSLFTDNKDNFSHSAKTVLVDILSLSSIPKHEWDEEAKKNKQIAEENDKKFQTVKDWMRQISQRGESELQECFSALLNHSQILVDNLGKLKALSEKSDFISKEELNNELSDVLKLIDFNSSESEKQFSKKNEEKGMFVFKYLNHIMESKISVNGSQPIPFKKQVNKENLQVILRACRNIVHDTIGFPTTARDYKFFIEPLMTSVPGQALSLNHKLTRCFSSGGYVDVHGLKNKIINNVALNLDVSSDDGSLDREFITSGFVLSGPKGTGKSTFAKVLANQMALPLFVLTKDLIKHAKNDIYVQTKRGFITLSQFLFEVKRKEPCVLLLDEGEKLLVPRAYDDICVRTPTDEESKLTTKFLSPLQGFRNKFGASKVTVIVTSDLPPSIEVDLASINKAGQSQKTANSLYEYVSCNVTRDKRVDHKLFSFHQLYTPEQGEALAKHFLKPYVDSGRLNQPVDYKEVGKIVCDYTPAQIELAFTEAANMTDGPISLKNMLSNLTQMTKRKTVFDKRREAMFIKGQIKVLVVMDEKKTVEGEFGFWGLDFAQLAISADGLSDREILFAIEKLTPKALSQSNIIAAFNKAKEMKSRKK